MKKEQFSIRPSTYFLITLVGYLAISPLPGLEIVWAALMILAYPWFSKKGHVKPFEIVKDTLLMFVYTMLVVATLIVLGIFSLTKVGWATLVFLGIITEGIGMVTGLFPIVGDVLGAFINVFIVTYLIPGLTGMMVAIFIAFLTLIPGPTKGHNIVTILGLKLLTVIL